MKRKKLDFETKYLILNWLKANKEELLENRPPKHVTAKRVSTELGVSINPQTLSYISKVAGVVWSSRKNRDDHKIDINRSLRIIVDQLTLVSMEVFNASPDELEELRDELCQE